MSENSQRVIIADQQNHGAQVPLVKMNGSTNLVTSNTTPTILAKESVAG